MIDDKNETKKLAEFFAKTHYACNLQICKNILILFHLLFFWGKAKDFFFESLLV